MTVLKYLMALIASTFIVVVISIVLNWPANGSIRASVSYSAVLTLLLYCVFLSEPDKVNWRSFSAAFGIYVLISTIMILLALIYWDAPQSVTLWLAGPFERIGYFPGGDAWFPAALLIWIGSVLPISFASFYFAYSLKKVWRLQRKGSSNSEK